jgi:hypothetical protein
MTGRAAKAFTVVRALGDLGELVTLAPERQRAAGLADADGEALGSLVVERRERVVDEDLGDAVVLDTTHVKDGLVDVAAAARAAAPTSAKKRVRPGDLLVSRLRPYLRQIGLVTDGVSEATGGRTIACSTEFYVLSPPAGVASLAYLLPWLLGDEAQAVLAAAQEGGHHPRVPRETLLAMRVPSAVVKRRAATSRAVEGALAEVCAAHEKLRRALR